VLLERSVSVPSRSEELSGVIQAMKRWCSVRRHKRVNCVMKVRILCTVDVPLGEDEQVNA